MYDYATELCLLMPGLIDTPTVKLYLHPSMLKTAEGTGVHPGLQVAKPTRTLMNRVWEASRWRVEDNVESGLEIASWTRADRCSPELSASMGQGELERRNYTSRASVSGPVLNPEAWEMGLAGEPTRIPDWMRDMLKKKSEMGPAVYTRERKGNYVYQLLLHPTSKPLVDTLLEHPDLNQYLKPALNWIARTR